MAVLWLLEKLMAPPSKLPLLRIADQIPVLCQQMHLVSSHVVGLTKISARVSVYRTLHR